MSYRSDMNYRGAYRHVSIAPKDLDPPFVEWQVVVQGSGFVELLNTSTDPDTGKPLTFADALRLASEHDPQIVADRRRSLARRLRRTNPVWDHDREPWLIRGTRNVEGTERRILAEARRRFGRRRRFSANFEHGAWFLVDEGSGESWSVVETSRGIDFEEL